MTVRVLLFASYADALGRNEIELDLPDGAVVDDVLERLRSLAAGRELPVPMIAVNASYARSGHGISAGDEVAIIPPVAGG
jgi:molybdopterin converting factor small subunit